MNSEKPIRRPTYGAAKRRLLLPRLLLGSIFVFAGLNGFFNFFNQGYSPEGQEFIAQLRASDMLWGLLHGIEVLGGSLLVFSTGQLSGILILAPVTAGIAAFHILLSPQGSALGIVAVALEVFFIGYWWKNLVRLFHHRRHHASPQYLARHSH